jgi:hypothetical protein
MIAQTSKQAAGIRLACGSSRACDVGQGEIAAQTLRWTPSDVISTREFLIARVNHRVSYHQFRAARSGRAVYMSAIKHEISRRQTAATGFPGRTKSRQYMDFVFLKNAFKCICDAFNDAVIE